MSTPDTTPRAFPMEGELALAEAHLRNAYASPRAGLLELLLGGSDRSYRMVGDVAVIDVHGPLDQRGDFFWDGYDSVLDRAREAFGDDKVSAVVVALDSPGGVVAGCFDSARELRAVATSAGKPFVAHAGTMACSAAYALACAADQVMVTGDGAVGSVGVIATVYDRTASNAQEGLDVRVVRSGTLKSDPHPDVALTDASVSRVRARVMDLAQSFAAWVADRRGLSTDAVLAHQGATVYAARALEAGFADAIGTLADAINTAAGLAASQRKRMDTEKQLAAMIAALGAGSHEEALATVAAMKKASETLPSVTRERDDARAALAARDAADASAARDAVLAKHEARGALTPALKADGAFMADLAPLGADALDRVLGKLQSVAREPVTPRVPRGADLTATKSVTVTARDKEFARAVGLSEEAVAKVAAADAARSANPSEED